MISDYTCNPRRWAISRGKLATILTMCLWFVRLASPQDTSLMVDTKSGKVRGVSRPSGGAEFLGIPYAQPPLGNLRWHEPVPVQPWKEARDASTFGAPCAQPLLGDWNRRNAESGKEDCLFLNVMTSAWPAKERLPVMVWLHGGGNEGGTASSPLYKDGTLVQHGIILVTVNYRLGVFGFFAHPGLTQEFRTKLPATTALWISLPRSVGCATTSRNSVATRKTSRFSDNPLEPKMQACL